MDSHVFIRVLHVWSTSTVQNSQHHLTADWLTSRQLGCDSARCNRLPAVSAAESSSHGPWSPGTVGPVGPVASAAAFKVSNKGPHSPSLVSRHVQVIRVAKLSRNQTQIFRLYRHLMTLTLACGTNSSSTIVRPAKIHPDSPDAVDCPSVALASSAAASLAAASPSSLYLAQLRFGMRSTMKWSKTTTERKPKTVTHVLICVYMFTYVYTMRVHVYVYVYIFFSLRILCLHFQQCHNCHSSSYHFRCAIAAMLFPHPTWHQVLDRTPTAAISAREAERRAAVLAATGPLDAPRRNHKWFL